MNREGIQRDLSIELKYENIIHGFKIGELKTEEERQFENIRHCRAVSSINYNYGQQEKCLVRSR